MNTTVFQDSEWYNAVTLTERADRLELLNNDSSKFSRNKDGSNQIWERWRSRSYLKNDLFGELLNVEKLDENKFRYILGEDSSDLQKRFAVRPNWLVELESLFSEFFDKNDIGKKNISGLSASPYVFENGLLEPFISEGKKRLREGIEQLAGKYRTLPFNEPDIERIFVTKLLQRLAMMVTKTLALEVNVARLREELEGDTPEERYNYFLKQLNKPEISLPILKEYSVLTRNALIEVNKWSVTGLEFLDHLCEDREKLCEIFNNGESLGLIESLDVEAGDSHRGGRSVTIVTFNTKIKIVYKPRSLSVDVNFQNLLEWVNKKNPRLSFKTLKILDCDSHGWVGFVENNSCVSEKEVKNFYFRQGCFLALLYILEAVDFHAENLIADGEHPVLVDLESLFHPNVKLSEKADKQDINFNEIAHSVLRVGLLPQRMWAGGKDNSKGMDVSGLGGASGQITPYKIPQWEKIGTDEMHLIRKQIKVPISKNRPSLNGVDVNTLRYSDSVLEGFSSMYRLLQQHRDELLSKDGPLEMFAESEIRYIARPTRIYSLLLHESYHPDLLRSALDRDLFFSRLWVGVESQPYLLNIIQAETNDLQNGDIPIFSTFPNSLNIYSSQGICIPDYLETSGFDLVKERINNLSQSDLDLQTWFIKASFASLASETDGATWGGYKFTEPTSEIKTDHLIAMAEDVGDRLISLANKNGEFISWTGVSLVGRKTWALSPVGLDLYNGLPGIILFLAYLGFHTGNRKYTDIARAAFNTFQLQFKRLEPNLTSIGGFDGWGGLIYLFLHLGTIWEDPQLLSEAENGVKKIRNLINADKIFDVLGGSAGAVWALHALNSRYPSDQTVETIIRCGEHLVSQAQPVNSGVGWTTKVSEIPLTGISHGTAGICQALFLVSTYGKEKRFKETALESLRYERSLFSKKAGNWSDLRDLEDDTFTKQTAGNQHYMTAWCHGAPGIGMARLCSLEYFDDPAIREEISAAIQTTLATGFGQNHSLCHGDLGNLELLLNARGKVYFDDLEGHIERLTALIYESMKVNGWLCGLPLNVETPGFMTGLAGIGYGLLRLFKPEKTPSVLVFEPPVKNRT